MTTMRWVMCLIGLHRWRFMWFEGGSGGNRPTLSSLHWGCYDCGHHCQQFVRGMYE